jgi:TPR repeat protein
VQSSNAKTEESGSDVTRATILAAARVIAERDGIEKLTLGQVATEAGVPRAAVYGQFTRKEDLLTAIAADDLTTLAHGMRGTERLDDAVRPEAPAVPSDTVLQTVPRDGTVESIVAAVAQGRSSIRRKPIEAEPAAETSAVKAPDAWLERRLRVFEKTLAAIESKQQELERNTRSVVGTAEESINAFAEHIRAIDERVDASDARHKKAAIELRAALNENALRIETVEGVTRAALASPHPVAVEAPIVEAAPAEHFEPGPVVHPEPETPAPMSAEDKPASFIADQRRSIQAAQAAAATAALAAAKPVKVKRAGQQRTRLIAIGIIIASVFIAAAGIAFSKGVMDGRADAFRRSHPVAHLAPTPRAVALVHVRHQSPLDRLTALAEAGNANAEFVVGTRYLNGESGEKDSAAAVHWLTLSAVHGQPMAQYLLGTLYQRGVGTPVDMATAMQWYEAAAVQGNRKAMHDLAIAYADGSGGAKNPQEAARWFSRAASFGYVDSEFDLAVLYERGDGVPQSLLDAYKWYAVASAQGDSESKNRIDALKTQLNADDLVAATNAAKAFHPLPINMAANVAPLN